MSPGGEPVSKPAWSWKVTDPKANVGLNMLYEPGNWGDVIKAVWVIAAARALVEVRSLETVRVLDPYAGAPTYPLTPSAAERFAGLPPLGMLEMLRPFLERDAMAAAGVLAAEAVRRAGATPTLQVFDLDEARRARWEAEPGAEVVSATSGDDLFGDPQAQVDLLVVDPYDLFDRWEGLLPRVLTTGRRTTAVIYLYNKSVRGAAALRRYQDLRTRLAKTLAQEGKQGRGLLLGRIPTDPVLPRAFHEMLLVAPRDVLAAAREELRSDTLALARLVAAGGAFEDATGSPQGT